MTEAKPLRADAQRNREALLLTARKIFEDGEYDLRFDDFAKLAGVGTGTLYRHFPNREALAAAVYQQEVAALCARAGQLQATLPGAEALANFVRGFIDYMAPRQGLARTLVTLMAPNHDQLAAGSRALETAVSELVLAGVTDGTLRPDANAGSVLIALHGIGATHDRPDWRAESDGLATALLDGLRHQR